MTMYKFAFFDVDHTLTRYSTGRRFACMGARAGLFPIHALLRMPLYHTLYRLGALPIQKIDREIPFLKGKKKQELEILAKKTFDHWIKQDLFPEAHRLIQSLHTQGTQVVLATSSLDMLIEPLARFLGIEEFISSSLEFVDNQSTGILTGSPVFGEEKRRLVVEFLKQKGCSPEESAFYSDSINDLPLLETVNYPVAVNPDIKLKRLSRKRMWPILYFK